MDDRKLKVVASVGLAVGGALGMAGTFAPSASLRGLAWGIDGTALVTAGAIIQQKGTDLGSGLAIQHFTARVRD